MGAENAKSYWKKSNIAITTFLLELKNSKENNIPVDSGKTILTMSTDIQVEQKLMREFFSEIA